MSDKHRVRVWVQRFKDREHLVLQWLDATGKRKSRSAGTADPEVAKREAARLEVRLEEGLYRDPGKWTWEAFRQHFESEYVSGLRPRTRTKYGQVLDSFERLANPGRLASVTERTVSAWVAALRKEPCRGRVGLMPSTIHVHLTFLHCALAWAASQKMLPAVPAFPAVKVPKKRPQPVPAESFERLVGRAGDDLNMRAFVLCGWRAGLRLGEAHALEWERADVAPYLDLDRDRIVLPAAMVKADEDQWLPLDGELRAALEALTPPPRSGRVFHFPTRAGTPAALATVSRRVVLLARKAGVRLTMKTLRRGFGCYYAAREPAQVLQRLMRHANIKTTMDFYCNVDDATEAAVRRRNTPRNSADPDATAETPRAGEGKGL
jgi:integrase